MSGRNIIKKTICFMPVILASVLIFCGAIGEDLPGREYLKDLAGIMDDRRAEEISLLAEEIDRKADVELIIVTTREIAPPADADIEAEVIIEEWKEENKDSGKEAMVILLDMVNGEVSIKVTGGLERFFTRSRISAIKNVLVKRQLERNDPGGAVTVCVIQAAKILRDGMEVDIEPVYNRKGN